MMCFLAQILGQLLAIDEFTLSVPFNEWAGCLQWSFTECLCKTSQEGNRDFVIEFVIDEVDNFLRDRWFSGF